MTKEEVEDFLQWTASVREAKLREEEAEVALLPEPEPESFHGYVRRQNPTLLRFEHIERLVSVGERVITGELRRVMLLMPPRYLKSEVFSRLLPGAWLKRHPQSWVGLASYGADLAWELSEEARGYYARDGGVIRTETSAKKRWRNEEGGGMLAAGAAGQWLGRGFRLGIVDDPTDPEKAVSHVFQKKFQTWWAGKFLSRREPDSRLVFVMQRLGSQDPVDFLFRREVGEDTDFAPMNWHVVVCDEVKDDGPLGRWDGPRGLPPTCTLEPDEREVGEVLAPTRFDAEEVAMMQTDAGIYVTASQRQQRPQAPTGDFWEEDFFQVYTELPETAFNGGRDWDTAYTKDERNSASVQIESYRGPGKNGYAVYIEDVDWRWCDFPELVSWMRGLDGPHHIEAKASGKSASQVLRRENITVREVKVSGDKLARAAGVQPIVANRRIFVNERVRRKLLHGDRQGLLRVTAETLATDGPDLDLNDAFVQAISRHTGGRKRHGVFYPGMREEGENGTSEAAESEDGRRNGR